MKPKAIEVQNLHKHFDEIRAVDGVSFGVEQGEIFSLLGPNGAGKTTTISMLSCLLRPEEGDALVLGHSIRKDPSGLGFSSVLVPAAALFGYALLFFVLAAWRFRRSEER
jgi:ABC-2 type transport system ATP-binding protein